MEGVKSQSLTEDEIDTRMQALTHDLKKSYCEVEKTTGKLKEKADCLAETSAIFHKIGLCSDSKSNLKYQSYRISLDKDHLSEYFNGCLGC